MDNDRTSTIIMFVAVGVPVFIFVAAALGWTDWMVNP